MVTDIKQLVKSYLSRKNESVSVYLESSSIGMLVLVCAEIGKKQFLILSTEKLQNYNNKTYAQSNWRSNAVFRVEINAVGDKCTLVTTYALRAFAFLRAGLFRFFNSF